MEGKWECIGFEFPAADEEYPDSVVKVIMDMKVSPACVSIAEARVISNAPELLRISEVMAKLACDRCNGSRGGPNCTAIECFYAEAEAAIAKARGEG